MASPGMMQSGLSRQLFEAWCTDKRNGVVIAGYCVEGTLAKVRRERREREKGQSKYYSNFHVCPSGIPSLCNFCVLLQLSSM